MKSLLTLSLISGLMGVQSAKAAVDCTNQALMLASEKYSAQSPSVDIFTTSLKFKPVEKDNLITYYVKVSDPVNPTATIIEMSLDKQTCDLVK